MRTRVARAASASAALAAVLVAAGCSSSSGVDAQGPVTPAPSRYAPPTAEASATAAPSASSTTSSTTAEKSAILSQYKAFFASLTPLSKVEANTRYKAMRKLATDPELTRVMGGMAASTKAGEVGYGDITVRPEITAMNGSTAEIKDCQDTSTHGRKKASTGQKITVGRKNDLAKVTMKRGDDGIWRVAAVEYAPAGSCEASA